MKRIPLVAACLSVVTSLGAQVADFVVLPVQARVPAQDKGYLKADRFAFALASRPIAFSGYNWLVKTSSGRVGPGPNYFSDSQDNVWVDDKGRLHLKITKIKNRYYCAEVISKKIFGHGTYIWELDSPVDNLDRNVVLGLFTWSDSSEYANGEIDIEFSRWGSRNYPNAQFVVQPYNAAGHMVRFEMPVGLSQTTHSFLWAPEGVIFQSLAGHWLAADPALEDIIAEWAFVPGDPDPWPQVTSTENARMNLWLYQGTRPSDRQEVEVVFKSFSFEPY